MTYCKIEKRLEYKDLFHEFYSGCKTDEQIGMEYERIPVYTQNNRQVPYSGDSGICNLLIQFANTEDWEYILEHNTIIGLKKEHDTITLEPGCQLEISLKPQNSVVKIQKKIESIDKALNPFLTKFGIKLINYGISPNSTYKNIKLIPKQRYHIMANYLWGILSDVMMRETAGIQVGIDYKSEQDAIRKFRLANIIMPFATAMYANSKIRGGVDTGYLSFRALTWLNTDNERCGFATNFNKNMEFKDYVNLLLDTPMIFINRDGRALNLNGQLTFNQYMQKGYEGFVPTLEDWKLHSNLYFPEVRLRNYIEIRNHDCVGGGLEYSIPALYKGIMYSDDAMTETENLLEKFTIREIKELRYSVPTKAIHSSIGNKYVADICKELAKISYYSLKKQNKNEENFLTPLINMLNKNKCPAEILIN